MKSKLKSVSHTPGHGQILKSDCFKYDQFKSQCYTFPPISSFIIQTIIIILDIYIIHCFMLTISGVLRGNKFYTLISVDALFASTCYKIIILVYLFVPIKM